MWLAPATGSNRVPGIQLDELVLIYWPKLASPIVQHWGHIAQTAEKLVTDVLWNKNLWDQESSQDPFGVKAAMLRPSQRLKTAQT